MPLSSRQLLRAGYWDQPEMTHEISGNNSAADARHGEPFGGCLADISSKEEHGEGGPGSAGDSSESRGAEGFCRIAPSLSRPNSILPVSPLHCEQRAPLSSSEFGAIITESSAYPSGRKQDARERDGQPRSSTANVSGNSSSMGHSSPSLLLGDDVIKQGVTGRRDGHQIGMEGALLIRAAREQLGLFQHQFARLIGIHESTIHHVESGKTRLTERTRVKIEAVIGPLIP